MSRRYAADTIVSAERTQAEISTLLGKHGATARAVGIDDAVSSSAFAFVMFALAGRRIRVEVPLPDVSSSESRPRGWWQWSDDRQRSWTVGRREQRERSTWRGLLLLLRAKLEAIEGGYSSVEREFLADVLLPGGQSVGQLVSGVVEMAYTTGTHPRLLTEAAAAPKELGPAGASGVG